MNELELDNCCLPPEVWDWIITCKKEDEISSFLSEEIGTWLIKQGVSYNTELNDAIGDFSATAARALITENDIVEAVRLGLLVFIETPFEIFTEKDDTLIAAITVSLCNWFNNENDATISPQISYSTNAR